MHQRKLNEISCCAFALIMDSLSADAWFKKKKSQTEPNKPFFHHATSFFPFLKTNITFSNKSIECVAVLYKHQLQILITYFSVVFVVFSLNAVFQFFPVFTCDSVTLTFCVSSPLSAAFLNYFCSINRGRSNFSEDTVVTHKSIFLSFVVCYADGGIVCILNVFKLSEVCSSATLLGAPVQLFKNENM